MSEPYYKSSLRDLICFFLIMRHIEKVEKVGTIANKSKKDKTKMYDEKEMY